MARSTVHFVLVGAASVSASVFTPLLSSTHNFADYGQVDGFTFPRLGGDGGDQTVFGTYTDEADLLMVYDSFGGGRISGVNASTTFQNGSFSTGFGDFDLSYGSHPAGGPVITFVSTIAEVDGVYLQMPSGVIVEVANTVDMFAPAGYPIYYLAQPSVAMSTDKSHAYVVFAARAGPNRWRGIIQATIPSDAKQGYKPELTVVADTSMLMPRTTDNFKCLQVPQISGTGDVVFFGSHCGRSAPSPLVLGQFNKLAFYGKLPRGVNILTKNLAGWKRSSSMNAGIWKKPVGQNITEIVDIQTTIPGGKEGERFVAFSDPALGDDGTAAFVAVGNNGSYGCYKAFPNQPLQVVANRLTEVPGYPGYNFASIPNVPSIGDGGQVAFFGEFNSEIGGIFAESSSGLQTVITMDTLVDGKELMYVGFGTAAYNSGVAALYMVMNDTTNGVFTTNVTNPAIAIALV